MSMNFGRELSLLRVRLKEAATKEAAARRERELGDGAAFLGADDAAVAAAASDLVATYPEMGRAQMTAFVRTLWQSGTHELQAVGVRILTERAKLLEIHDLDFVTDLLFKCENDALAEPLGGEVLGTLAAKNKKVWKELARLAAHSDPRRQIAAVRACRLPLLADETIFDRFADLAEPLLQSGNADVLAAIDEVLSAVASVHVEAAQELAARHGRRLKLPRPPSKAAGKESEKKAGGKKSTGKKKTAKKPATKKADH